MADVNESVSKALDATVAGVEKLADTMRELAPGAWEVLVRQQVIEGTSHLVWAAVLVLVALIGGRLGVAATRTAKDRGDAEAGEMMAVVVVMSAAALAVALLLTISGTKSLLNPEYYAGMELAEKLRR